jgi:hypothetical protein
LIGGRVARKAITPLAFASRTIRWHGIGGAVDASRVRIVQHVVGALEQQQRIRLELVELVPFAILFVPVNCPPYPSAMIVTD